MFASTALSGKAKRKSAPATLCFGGLLCYNSERNESGGFTLRHPAFAGLGRGR